MPARQVPGGQVPGGQVPGRTSYPRTSAMEDKFPQLSDSIKKRSGTCPPGTCPPGTDTPQLNNIPQMLAEYIQYEYISQKMYITQPCARRAHRHLPTWIYSANNCGVLFSWGCLCALRAQGWTMYNKRDNCNIRRTSTRRTSARPFLMLSESWGNLSSMALVLG